MLILTKRIRKVVRELEIQASYRASLNEVTKRERRKRKWIILLMIY
jgi:hypothetical protein